MNSFLQNQRILKRLKPIRIRTQNYTATGIFSFFANLPHKRRKSIGIKSRIEGLPKKAFTYPFLIGIVFAVLLVFLSSSYMFSMTGNDREPGNASLALPGESTLEHMPGQYEFVESLPDERDEKMVSLKKTKSPVPELPVEYIVSKGDTIYSISKQYDVSVYDLIRANRITDPTRLRVNDTIVIPGYGRLQKGFSDARHSLPTDISVLAASARGNAPFTTNFFVTTKLDISEFQFLWDLGNDRYSFDPSPKHTYSKPGMYDIFVIVSDSARNEVVSNKVTVEVKSRHVHRVEIDSPMARYFTLGQVNDLLEIGMLVPKKARDSLNSDNIKMTDDHQAGDNHASYTLSQQPELFKNAGENRYVSVKAGFSEITVSMEGARYSAQVFVSPFATKHSFEPEYNWYKTQFATGINGNCGPACISMATLWAKGEDVPVAKIRQEIGLPFANGAIDFSHMTKSFAKHSVRYREIIVTTMDDFRKVIDRGNIALVLFNTRSISKVKGSPQSDFVGRYYEDISGHYIIIKGYTSDGRYVVAYDPMPSDWVSNSARHDDGKTMLGKNRYYPASQLFASMNRQAFEIIR